jgi:hypothetical protein
MLLSSYYVAVTASQQLLLVLVLQLKLDFADRRLLLLLDSPVLHTFGGSNGSFVVFDSITVTCLSAIMIGSIAVSFAVLEYYITSSPKFRVVLINSNTVRSVVYSIFCKSEV